LRPIGTKVHSSAKDEFKRVGDGRDPNDSSIDGGDADGGDADLSDWVWFDGGDADDENDRRWEPHRLPPQSSIHKTRHHTSDGFVGCKTSSNREETDAVVPAPLTGCKSSSNLEETDAVVPSLDDIRFAGGKPSSNREETDAAVPFPLDNIHDATLDCITVEEPTNVDDERDNIGPRHGEDEVRVDLAPDERDDDGDSAYEESEEGEGDVSFTSDRARRTGQEDTLCLSNAEDLLHSATQHLQSLWSSQCDCQNECDEPVDSPVVSLQELTQFWRDKSGNIDPLADPNLRTRTPALESLPWKSILAGDGHPPTLSFAKSESERGPAVVVQRTRDVDSILSRISTLAAHRETFNISYYPKFKRRITSDVYTAINKCVPRSTKHLRLGHGELSSNFHCYMFFPNMEVKESTHLTLADQEELIARPL
jgi:hypothetical protein